MSIPHSLGLAKHDAVASRSFDGPGSKVTTRLNASGDLIITISAGAVSICATVPQRQVAFMTFAERMQAQDQAA